MRGQVKEFGEWQDILESLAGRGLDSDLIEELQDMGPDAIAQIEALNNMSDSELWESMLTSGRSSTQWLASRRSAN